MIFDSVFWKIELEKNYRGILKFNNIELFRDKFETTYNNMEKHIFLSAFIIRKLIESNKLTDRVDSYEKQILGYTPLVQINRLNRFEIWENFDLSDCRTYNIQFKNICNWLIHSYVCQLYFDEEEKAIGFFISSDYDKNKVLYYIDLDDWLKYIKLVVDDQISKIKYNYCKDKLDFLVTEKK